METWEAINSIRVVRQFEARALDEKELNRILHAGRRAGSSKNLQRWTFIVVRERKLLEELSTVGDWAGHLAGAAAAVALVSPDPVGSGQPLSVMWDLGRVAQNMVLAAWELGIGSVPATVYDHARAAELLGLPEDQHCEYLLSFGYPADSDAFSAPKQSGGRRRLDEVVRFEQW